MNSTYQAAINLLVEAATPNGFIAANQSIDNYGRIWTRDSVVCGLAALSSGESLLINSFKRSLETILRQQHPLGMIPSNVTSTQVSFGGPVGRADTPAWLVLGFSAYCLATGDRDFASTWQNAIEKALLTLEYWEFNSKNLVYVPRSGDWADESDLHGYLLSTQLLRLKALQLAAKLYEREEWEVKAQKIKQVVQEHYHLSSLSNKAIEPSLNRLKHELPEYYWLAGFNPGKVYPRFDLLANALSLWTEIGTQEQNQRLFLFLDTLSEVFPCLLPAFYPEIKEDDSEMKVLQENFSYRFRNEPGSFHNGGLWPVWHGLMVAAAQPYQPQLSQKLLERMNRLPQGTLPFNECYHADTLIPNGISDCSWSAAGYILATKGLIC